MRCLVLGGRCSGQRLGHPSYLLCRALETADPFMHRYRAYLGVGAGHGDHARHAR